MKTAIYIGGPMDQAKLAWAGEPPYEAVCNAPEERERIVRMPRPVTEETRIVRHFYNRFCLPSPLNGEYVYVYLYRGVEP
jgi:hypothetical protein